MNQDKNHNLEKRIIRFSGFSGSNTWLLQDTRGFFVRKENNVQRNADKLSHLKDAGFLVPRIINFASDILDIEYVHGLDIKTYLTYNNYDLLLSFIKETIKKFDITTQLKDYSKTYSEQLKWIEHDLDLPFNANQLIERLPSILPSSMCHGDFTFDNLIFKNGQFYMIDPSTGPYDSWVFDLAKLRQDLDCKWFLRSNDDPNQFSMECHAMKQSLAETFPNAFDDMIYILMLLRVYKYTHTDTLERQLILKEIQIIWKF